MITFNCPSCGNQFRAQDEWAGKKARCNNCQCRVTIPTLPEPVSESVESSPFSDNSAPVKYAGFWRRVGAYWVDVLILTILSMSGVMLVGVYLSEVNFSEFDLLLFTGLVFVFTTFVQWLYYTKFETSTKQGTPGKWLFGIKVVDLDGKQIDFQAANQRFWIKCLIISISWVFSFNELLQFFIYVLCCASFLTIVYTIKKQAIHDMVAKTLVICTKSEDWLSRFNSWIQQQTVVCSLQNKIKSSPLLVVAICFAVVIIGFAGFAGLIAIVNQPDIDQIINAKDVIKVDSQSFAREFDNNPFAAGKKYNGKIVEISGRINEVSTTDWDRVYIGLDHFLEGFPPLLCLMAEGHEDSTKILRKWRPVIIRGRCVGLKDDAQSRHLRGKKLLTITDCILVEYYGEWNM